MGGVLPDKESKLFGGFFHNPVSGAYGMATKGTDGVTIDGEAGPEPTDSGFPSRNRPLSENVYSHCQTHRGPGKVGAGR